MLLYVSDLYIKFIKIKLIINFVAYYFFSRSESSISFYIIMLILYTNPDKFFTKTQIFDKLIENLNINKTIINREFKFKFMIVLNQLDKYDVKVTNNSISLSNEINTDILPLISTTELPTMEDVSEYIIENNLLEIANYNSLPYDLIRGNKFLMIEKMLENDENILFFITKNETNKSALKFIKSHQITNIFIEKLYDKILELSIKLEKISERITKIEKNNNNNNKLTIYNYLSIVNAIIMFIWICLIYYTSWIFKMSFF